MKKTLFKIAFVAVISLSVVHRVQASVNLSPFDFFKSAEVLGSVSKKARHFSRFLAMGTQENLKAYHLGLETLFAGYRIPSAQDLFDSIRSHSNFLGFLTENEAVDRLSGASNSFVIFEEKNGAEAHFYIVHPKGIRHFNVNGIGFAGLDNSEGIQYPSLASFLESTVAF